MNSRIKCFFLGAQSVLICLFLVQMTSKIKGHRRNKAIGQDDQHFRMSVPPLSSCYLRNSCDNTHIPLIDFRNSDANELHLVTPTLKENRSYEDRKTAKGSNEKTGKNLLLTMKGLQMKLAEAKKQLSPAKKEPLCQFSMELGQPGEDLEYSRTVLADSILEKLEESTINLESNRKLITAVKSKERILWSNKVKTYYLKEIVRGLAGINERALEHLTISHQILYSAQSIELPEPQRSPQFFPITPKTPTHVLVLDLDETIFHCDEHRQSPQDIEVDIPVENGVEKAYVSVRPYAFSFLKHCKKYFQIFAFTASQRCYADAILNEIDPQGQFFSHRLYREHCTKLHNKVYAKDLRIINRDLSKIVLVDNSPLSYLYQVMNGIPILPYYGGEDTELLGLEKYLEKVRGEWDVRKLNHSTFKLSEYGSFEDCESLVKQLYCPSI